MSRPIRSRVVLLITATAFVCAAFVAAGHLHSGPTAGVKTDCQLCSLSHLHADRPVATPILLGLAVLASLLLRLPVAPPHPDSLALQSPRAPPRS